MFPELNELLFSIVVSYMGALEFIFVMKHLYHWIFQHQKQLLSGGSDGESLEELQNRIKAAIEEAKANEFGEYKAMKDGVLYKDGFRVDPDTIKKEEQPRRQLIGSSRNGLEDREEVCEEPCVKKIIRKSVSPVPDSYVARTGEPVETERPHLSQSIKTQFGQTNNLKVQPHNSEDSSSNEPMSSQKSSSLSNQQSSSIDTTFSMPEIHFDEYERQAPDGEDVPDENQYSDDYLRSLDGIKHRPLVREDGTGRRRAFKKRRSSGDSTSSRESRTSREEELKMFTSLEEEELEAMKRGESEYAPIRYSSDSNLKVGKHHKRHKKSPVKDSKHTSDVEESKSSLEMLDEEENNPWGEIKPEHYKNSEFWQREKTISIEEEDDDADNLNSWQKSKDELPTVKAGLQLESSPRNIPKASSFEEATDTQHEVVFNALKQQSSIDEERKESKNDSNHQKHENVSMDRDSDDDTTLEPNAVESNASSDDDTTHNACDLPNAPVELDDDQENDLVDFDDYQIESAVAMNTASSLRHSKKAYRDLSLQDDWDEEEFPPPEDLDQDYMPEQEDSNLDEEDSYYNQTPPSYVDEDDQASTDRGLEVRSYSLPEIEIVETEDEPIEVTAVSNVLEGLSDFYDFNASVNPSRSPSVDRSKSKTPRPVSRLSFHEPEKIPESTPPPIETFETIDDLEGLSDFFDFSVMLNRSAFDKSIKRSRSAHRSSVDYLVENLEANKSIAAIKKNDKKSLLDIKSPAKFSPLIQSPETPSSPECRRSFSTEQRDIDRLREKYQKNAFQRSTYIGESTDFKDDFEELREQTRHFQRSRSKSRSLVEEELDELDAETSASSSRRALQDKILAEITKTTINYQEFSRDMNQKFIDHERRGSDSALIPKPEILIQIDSERRDGNFDYEDDLDSEEYHHFRRFSLNQEYQVEEYPSDGEFEYYEQIEVRSLDATENWTRQDFYGHEEDTKNDYDAEEIPSVSLETVDDSDREAEGEDTGSEDDRRTVVEVDDEMDGDRWENDRRDDHNNNDQSDGDDLDMQEYRTYENGNLNEGDWKEEGAVGGAVHYDHRNSLIIEQIYDDAVKNLEESGIERDYDTLFEAVNSKPTESEDSNSIRTEDLLEEILNEEDQKYHWRSKNAAFLDHERGSSISSTTSARLRTRYGIGTASLSYTSYELGESTRNTETPKYAPKKEYNWRKNFKLDDDDGDSSNNSNSKHDRKLSFNVEETEDDDEKQQQSQQHLDFLDLRKMSLGGESITLYSRTPDRFQDFNSGDEAKAITPDDDDAITQWNKTPIEEIEQIDEVQIEPETPVKKKKKRKTTRKGSKASIDDITESDSRRVSIDENQIFDEEDAPKKKSIKKKKKKSKDHSVELIESKENSPVSPNLEARKSKSPTKVRSKLSKKSPDLAPSDSTSSPKPDQTASLTKDTSNFLTSVSSPDNKAITSKSSTTVLENKTGSASEPGGSSSDRTTGNRTRAPLERKESSGAYELIKDGSMYPWF